MMELFAPVMVPMHAVVYVSCPLGAGWPIVVARHGKVCGPSVVTSEIVGTVPGGRTTPALSRAETVKVVRVNSADVIVPCGVVAHWRVEPGTCAGLTTPIGV